MFTTSNLLYILAGDAGWVCRCGPRCNLSIVYLYGSLHESYVHERLNYQGIMCHVLRTQRAGPVLRTLRAARARVFNIQDCVCWLLHLNIETVRL